VVTQTKASILARRPNGRGWETYRGCLKSVGRWRTLVAGSYDGYGGVAPGQAALGGRYAAVAVFVGDHYSTGTVSLELVNLRTGHHREPLHAGHTDGDLGPHHYAVTALAVSRFGTLGWVAQEYGSNTAAPDLPGPHATVVGHDASGTRVLDSGGADAITAVRFRGATLTWAHDGAAREATLGTK
jgi:hypothetical protein